MKLSVPFLPFAAFSFVAFGSLLVLIGASQAELAVSLDLDLAQTGLLGSSMVFGIGIGVLAAGPLVDRIDRRPLFIVSVSITAIALGTVDSAMSFHRAVAHVLLAGLGGGLYETVLNAVAIERYGERAVRMLTLLHSGATVGAILTPLAIGALATSGGIDASGAWPASCRAVGAAHLAFAMLAPFTRLGLPARTRVHADRTRAAGVFTPALAALCVASFAYIGVESAVTVFSIPYARDGLAIDPEQGRRAISLFWLGLLGGRLAFALTRTSEDARWAAIAGGSAALLWGVGVASRFASFGILMGLTGFALGGVFPLLVALAGRRSPQAPGTAVGIVAGIGSLGGFVVPWLTGIVGDGAGIRAAAGAVTVWCLLVALGAVLSERRAGGAPRE